MNAAFRFMLVAALLCAANLHLPVMQVIAWTGMIIRYSEKAEIGDALRKTFDGDHPCPMCLAIKKEQSKPRHQLSATAAPELKMTPPPTYPAEARPWMVSGHQSLEARGVRVFSRPPTPPPRFAA